MKRTDDPAIHGEEADLVDRYVAGRLTDEEASAFEAHYFACAECWAAVQRALEIRAAFHDVPEETAAAPRGWARRPVLRPAWRPMAAAAAVAVLALGVWRLAGDGPLPDPGLRSGAPALAVALHADDATLTAAWPPVPEADVYRIRLFAADGALALERETADTSWIAAWADLPGLVAERAVWWEVQALDALREIVAGSGLLEIARPSDGF